MAMQKRLAYYEKLTKEEARMIQEALDHETWAHINEVKQQLNWLVMDMEKGI